MTLTYPREFPHDSRIWKTHLDRFRKRLNREHTVTLGYWKLEPQKRGAPHFHLLLWLDRPMDLRWLSTAWYECVGSGDEKHLVAGTNVQHLKSWNGVTAYVSKYVAKRIAGDDLPDYWHGIKWWGRWGDAPIEMVTHDLTRREFVVLRRLLCKSARSREIDLRRRSGRAGKDLYGLSLFCGEKHGEQLIGAARQIAETPRNSAPTSNVDEEGSTGIRSGRHEYQPQTSSFDQGGSSPARPTR
ncbi:MAG: hypothetical protein AAFS11_11070, partial [Planctomycetota bacterium]